MRIMMAGLMMLLLTPPAVDPGRRVDDVTLHLDHRLYEECAIAAKSRSETLDQWIMETLEMAVSDRKILPKQHAPADFDCHMVSDGSLYCYRRDGTIFRPRYDDLILEAGK